MSEISQYVILSDLDGTLVKEDGKTIIPRNLEAIHRFVSSGGRFGIATGRPTDWVRPIAHALRANFPCILYNGGVIYDFLEEKTLSEEILPSHTPKILKKIQKEFPRMPIQAVSAEKYSDTDRQQLDNYRFEIAEEYAPFFPWQSNTSVWYKVLLGIRKQERKAFNSFLDTFSSEGIRFVYSQKTLGELLPKNATKGNALAVIKNKMKLPNTTKIVAIGDYYNDLDMIETSDIGVTLSTAPLEIKKASDIVVGNLQSGAVADIIEHLEKNIL